MDLWQLKVFCSVIKYKSFSRAGESIFLSQPTVSSHIKDLETHFGCRLIDRLGREAVPTRAGELLFIHAVRMLQLKEETETALSLFLGHAKGRLTIGGSTIPAGYIIPRMIGPFTHRYPDISLSVVTGDSAGITASVLSGDVEAGITGTGTNAAHIHQEKLMDDDMRLIVPAAHPLAGQKSIPFVQVLKEPFLARSEGSGTWKSLIRSMTDADFHPDQLNIIAHLDSTTAVIQGILNQAGVSILSPIAVEDELREKRLCALALEGVDLTRYFYLITHARRTCSPLVRLFIDFLKSHLPHRDIPAPPAAE